MKKFTIWVKRFAKWAFIIVLAIFLFDIAGIWLSSHPWKIKDPDDPRFDPTEFRIQDYNAVQSFRKVLPKLFEKGDEQEYVEVMLVERGGARKLYHGNNLYTYGFKPKNYNRYFLLPARFYNIGVLYDENNALVCLVLGGERIINNKCRSVDGTLKVTEG